MTVNVVIGRKGGPVEMAWLTSLATPMGGHILTILCPGLPWLDLS